MNKQEREKQIDELLKRFRKLGIDVDHDQLEAKVWTRGFLDVVQRLNGIEMDLEAAVRGLVLDK